MHPHGGSGSYRDRTIDRREFLRTALAIGGTGALAAVAGCTGLDGEDGGAGDAVADFDVPQGPASLAGIPQRQHAWAGDVKTDAFGNTVLPNHQLLLFLEYAGDGLPTDGERERVESAFRTLERAFQRLTGGDPDAANDGLVLMVGYAPSYFDRFDESLPSSVDLLDPETVLRETGDDPVKADGYDAVVLLSSANAPVVLAAEEALFGNLDQLNGVAVEGGVDGVFERGDRRTAFVGKGMPHEKLENDDVHEDAPLSMGYKSGFGDNVASEDAVTIVEGPFAGGTTFQVSKLRLDLDEWYDEDRATRDELMFSRDHGEAEIGEIGEGLADDSGITEESVDGLEAHARAHGRVGHAAKTARARNDEFEPLILRRSEGVNDTYHEDGVVEFNFTAVMEGIGDFVETRQAMNSTDLDPHVDEGGHGILPFMEVTNRATFLVPPRELRALPTPDPGSDRPWLPDDGE